eukprot:7075116-Alexandrium_andersonii.AAC.1
MASYGPPTGRLPKPWYAQVIPAPGRGPAGFRYWRPRELARLQGIPDTVDLSGDLTTDWRAVGDASPPALAGIM